MRSRSLCVLMLLFLGYAGSLCATTWYVRPDGGTRYSPKMRSGQCDGKADLAYPKHGTDQHCAFKDYRYLWDDQSYNNMGWVIQGGDTVLLRGGPWRVGFDQGKTPRDVWCFGANGPYSCSNPPLPAGTAEHHTRILGEHYADCADHAKMTQIFGGFAVGAALNLEDAQYVDVQCLEITRHSECAVHGDPIYPSACHTEYPLDDYDSEGVTTSVKTHDVLLQDLWIHGHTDRGILGPIGGSVTANRVDIAYNGMAGWDFDDGRGTASPNATLHFDDSIIEWSGCNQEYPARHAYPAVSCYGQSSGGYGDGIGTPANMGMDVYIDHSTFRYNTQDGEDFGHVDTGAHKLVITNSSSYANGGGQFKWGANFTSVFFADNVVIGNCMRMSAPIEGAPTTYNTHLGDFCRAQDAISFNFRQGGKALFANNTIVSYAPTTFDYNCWDKDCSASTLTFVDNIVLGYQNSATYSLGGKPGGPGGFYSDKGIGNVVRTNNIFFGLRNVSCKSSEHCVDPKFVAEPRFTREADLDNFDIHLTAASPARGAGTRVPEVTVDYYGHPRPASGASTIGASQ